MCNVCMQTVIKNWWTSDRRGDWNVNKNEMARSKKVQGCVLCVLQITCEGFRLLSVGQIYFTLGSWGDNDGRRQSICDRK